MSSSFKRALGINVAIQSLGAALSFLLAFGIAFLWGTTAQGQFALIKSWVEFGSLIALAGLPQGFVFAINRLGASAAALSRFSVRYCALSFPLALVGATFSIWLGYAPETNVASSAGILALALVAYTYHGLVRSILLTRNDGFAFSLFSIGPALLLALSVATMIGHSPDFYWVFMISSLGVMTASILAGKWIGFARDRDISSEEWRAIARQSVHSFAVSVLGSAQIVVLYATMRLLGASLSDVGLMSVALLVVSAVNVLCTMVSPVLYNRWSKQGDGGRLGQLSSQIALASFLGAAALTAVVALALFVAIRLNVSLAAQLKLPTLLLCCGLPAILYSRLIIPALFASGRPAFVTGSSLLRVALLAPTLWMLEWSGTPTLTAAALAFAAVEIAGGLWIAWTTIRKGRLTDMAHPIRASKA
jgi:O-antigen/teichoic acid export membrane protein